MTKVEIWTIAYSATFVMRFGARVNDMLTDNNVPTFSTGDRVVLLVFDMLAALPLVGRVFGWW